MPPAELLAVGRSEITRYGGEVVSATAHRADSVDNGFTVSLVDGRTVLARRLLVGTGLTDELPTITGLAHGGVATW
jgi:thioredoxin reductase